MARLTHMFLYLIQRLAGWNKPTIICPTAGCTDYYRTVPKHAVLSGFLHLFAHTVGNLVQNWLPDQHN